MRRKDPTVMFCAVRLSLIISEPIERVSFNITRQVRVAIVVNIR